MYCNDLITQFGYLDLFEGLPINENPEWMANWNKKALKKSMSIS